MTTNTTSATIQEIWQTRPPRIPKNQGSNAVVGGVCEGIGARYQVDPVIVRLAFVALTLTFGGGIFLYLLLWLVMPVFGTTISPWSALNTPKEEQSPFVKHERDSAWLLLFGLVIFFPSLSAGEGGWAAACAVSVLLAAAGIYLLHQKHPVPPAGLLAQSSPSGSTLWSPSTPAAEASRVDTSHLTVPEGFPHPGAGRITPPSWDPLGAAPELWHLPDPEPAAPAQPATKARRPLRILLPALGIMLSIWAVSFGAWAVLSGPHEVSVGDREYTVTGHLADTYSSGIGDTTLDLSGLEGIDTARTVNVTQGIGDLEILPPSAVRVEFHCSASIGTTSCPDTINPDAPGAPLRLVAHAGIGEVTVRR